MTDQIGWFLLSPYCYIIIAIFSLIVGSFLNVVIYRYPKMLDAQWRAEATAYLNNAPYEPTTSDFNLCKPRSHCPHCHFQFPAWHNVPVISFLCLRGRCGQCKSPISWRYPLIELLTMIASLVVVYTFGIDYYTAGVILLTWTMIAQSAIDADHQIIPDTMTYCLLWLGLILSSIGISPVPLASSVFGAVIGYLILWIIAKLFYLLRKKQGMGHGDFKLLAMIGAWSGPMLLPIVLIIASVCSLLFSAIWLLRKKMQRSTPIPFGPFLAIGGWVCVLWGPFILNWLALL